MAAVNKDMARRKSKKLRFLMIGNMLSGVALLEKRLGCLYSTI
jgi:NifU-like protein involved in Fe-S cluster formation